MYRITHVRLHNVCQHADLSVDIGSGITAVLGPNGAGKTNFARGLVYGLTGIVDGLWGNQQTMQKDGTATVGFAEVSFTDGAHTYRVRRCTVSSVKFPDIVTDDATGAPVAQRRQAVNAFMEEVFGMPVQLMFQICWGRQGELAMLLKSPPAAVGAFLQQVFDMKPLERIRDRIKTQLDTVASLSPDCQESLEADRKALSALPDAGTLDARVSGCDEALKAARARLEALVGGAGRMTSAERDAAVLRLSARADELARVIAESPQGFAGVPRTRAEVLADIDDAGRRAAAAVSRRDKAAHDLDLGRRMRDSELARASDLEERIRAASEAAGPLDGCLCRFCGARVADEASYRSRVSEAFGGTAELQAKAGAARASAESFAASVAGLEEQLPGLEKACSSEFPELQARLSGELAAVGRAEASEELDGICAGLEQLGSADVVSDGDAAELSGLRARIPELEAALRTALADRASAETGRRMLEAAVAAGERTVAQYRINKGARDALSFIRDALSQPRAQARYLKDRVQLLNIELSRYLSYTGMPFTMRLDMDTRAFVFTSAEGVVHPAAHLSGAQQAMSAVALQMALFAVMRPNMNLYLMDEPTEALDTENKAVMFGMFSRLNAMLPSMEGVMLLITRDAPVVEACSHTVELEAASASGADSTQQDKD